MLTKSQIDQFYRDVKKLDLKFPGSAISKATGFSKGQVSTYLNKHDEPSENFINAFYEKFGESLKSVPRENEIDLLSVTPDTISLIETKDFHKERLAKKNSSGPYMVPLVPIAAQAGYAKNFYDMAYIEKLETYPILPGIDPHGAIWRYFQVKGKSMEETFREGQFLLASQIVKEDWRNIENFYVYVVVTNEGLMIKRLAKVKGKDYWAAISDNESEFEQFKIPVIDVKELWKYRRHIEWDASPPKKFEVKV